MKKDRAGKAVLTCLAVLLVAGLLTACGAERAAESAPTQSPVPTAASTTSVKPSPSPSAEPTITPTPSAKPTVTPTPSAKPTVAPTPSAKPTVTPLPTAKSTVAPAATVKPTLEATADPTQATTAAPPVKQSAAPSATPHVHLAVTDPGTEATCQHTGLTEGSHCSLCGEILTPQSIIPLSAHQYRNGACVWCGAEDPDAVIDLDELFSEASAGFSDYFGEAIMLPDF